ncbi:MAG: hypothetical protein ACE5R6_14405 [Candidatus Heimdallarchaeota archaeon]
MILEFVIPFVISFIVTLVLTPYMTKKLEKIGIVGIDFHKVDKPRVPEMGGVIILIGMISSIIITATFVDTISKTILLAALCTLTLIAIIGMIDDLFPLKQSQKVILCAFGSAPLVMIRFGRSLVYIPFFGILELGRIYWFIIIPIAITGAANAINMLAGLNGLETGIGAIACGGLVICAFITDSNISAIFGLTLLGALLAFLKYNIYPAKIFPGDTGTLIIGASLAIMSTMGNMEKAGAVALLPMAGTAILGLHFFELFFKAKTKFNGESFGVLSDEGKLKPPKLNGKTQISSLTHLIMWKYDLTEKQIVYLFWAIQFVVMILVVALVYAEIFVVRLNIS